MLFLLLLACRPDENGPPSAYGSSGDDSAGTSDGGVIVLAGGGTEGEIGDVSSWSSGLYATLLRAGDINGDGAVTVAILATGQESEWLPEYFVWLGATEALNVRVASRGDTDAAAQAVASTDAAFIKGGDQGEYYDRWNDSALETALISLHQAGGGIGGTSAGAMSLAQFAFAGGADLVSSDVLANAQTTYLDDVTDGTAGVHDDFLGLVPAAVIDTHFTQRARLGRLAGILARIADDSNPAALFGIGIEEQTGLVIQDGVGTVAGVGSVTFLLPDSAVAPTREPALPLVWPNLALDRLTQGWRYDVAARAVDIAHLPSTADSIAWSGESATPAGEWFADGHVLAHEERFAIVVRRDPEPFSTHAGSDLPVLGDAIGILDAHDGDRRGANEESLFRVLYDLVGHTGFLVGEGTSIERRAEMPERVRFIDTANLDLPPLATLVVDTSAVTLRGLSADVSVSDAGDGAMSAATLVGARLHVLYSGVGEQLEYDTVARAVVPPP